MAVKTKLEFVNEMINEFPEATRLGIINRLVRHRRDYRGKKFTRQTASRYYWEATRNKKIEKTVSITLNVPNTIVPTVKNYIKALRKVYGPNV